jgi:hypothetical protein
MVYKKINMYTTPKISWSASPMFLSLTKYFTLYLFVGGTYLRFCFRLGGYGRV